MFQSLDRCFLFQKNPAPSLTPGQKILRHLWRLGLLLLFSALLGATLLIFAYGEYSWAVFQSYFGSPRLLFLNILPVVLLCLFFYTLTGQVSFGFLLGGGASLALSLGNYFKLAFRDDPVIFEDLLILREAGAMGGEHYALFVDKRILFALAAYLLAFVVLLIFARCPRRNYKLRLPVLAVVLISVLALSPIYMDKGLYDKTGNYTHLKRWAPTQEYLAHGFLYPFIHSISDSIDTPPEGYREKDAASLLAAYSDADIPADRKINVISIMREAYVDFSDHDIPGFDNSAYDIYHALQAESLTGELFVNIFAGGTIDTERSFLTGSHIIRDYRQPSNSYLWYLKDQGYTVEGAHPFNNWFYNRKNVNTYLGFDSYRYLEGDFERLTAADFPQDQLLYDEIYKDFCENKATGRPYFNFSVTVQSHGPYPTGTYKGSRIFLDGDYSAACENAMNHYMASIHSGDQALKALMDSLRQVEEPVALLVFSDHLPWMGNANSFYTEMGVNINTADPEGFRNHYTTEYLLWLNDAAKETVGIDIAGTVGPTLSPCYLMNLLFDTLGWDGPGYMQAMEQYRALFPVVSTLGQTMVEGELVEAIPPAYEQDYRDFQFLQYYWRKNFRYSN